jgi:hypothetical protein
MAHLAAQRFQAHIVQEQARRDKAIGGLGFNQRARRKDQALAHLVHRYPVVDITPGCLQNRLGAHIRPKSFAGLLHQCLERIPIERTPYAPIDHMD